MNKPEENCQHKICSPPPPPQLSEFGKHRSNLDLATFYTLQSRNQSFSHLGNQRPAYEILSKAAVDHSSMSSGIP